MYILFYWGGGGGGDICHIPAAGATIVAPKEGKAVYLYGKIWNVAPLLQLHR